jgi:hypothetical protein
MRKSLLIIVLSLALTIGGYNAIKAKASCASPYHSIGCYNCGNEEQLTASLYVSACVDQSYTSIYCLYAPYNSPYEYTRLDLVYDTLCGSECKMWRAYGGTIGKTCYVYGIYGVDNVPGDTLLFSGEFDCCINCP